jgi:hypothetical protein
MIVPAWKKPQASSPCACARRHARQEVSCPRARAGVAGRRIRRTVAALMWWPGRARGAAVGQARDAG